MMMQLRREKFIIFVVLLALFLIVLFYQHQSILGSSRDPSGFNHPPNNARKFQILSEKFSAVGKRDFALFMSEGIG